VAIVWCFLVWAVHTVHRGIFDSLDHGYDTSLTLGGDGHVEGSGSTVAHVGDTIWALEYSVGHVNRVVLGWAAASASDTLGLEGALGAAGLKALVVLDILHVEAERGRRGSHHHGYDTSLTLGGDGHVEGSGSTVAHVGDTIWALEYSVGHVNRVVLGWAATSASDTLGLEGALGAAGLEALVVLDILHVEAERGRRGSHHHGYDTSLTLGGDGHVEGSGSTVAHVGDTIWALEYSVGHVNRVVLGWAATSASDTLGLEGALGAAGLEALVVLDILHVEAERGRRGSHHHGYDTSLTLGGDGHVEGSGSTVAHVGDTIWALEHSVGHVNRVVLGWAAASASDALGLEGLAVGVAGLKALVVLDILHVEAERGRRGSHHHRDSESVLN